MIRNTRLPYEGNATAEYPLREAGDIGPRDRFPDDPVKIDFIGAEAIQILDKRQSKRCEPCSESSSEVQYNSTKKKFQYELDHYSKNYSFTAKKAIGFCILRLKNWKLHQDMKK